MTATIPPADLIRRMAQVLADDAAEHGIDLDDPDARRAFLTGFVVSLGWITAAHETGKIDDASFRVLDDLLSAAVSSLKPEGDAGR